MLDILVHHWATWVYLGWLLLVILGNALTWRNGGSVRGRKPLPLESDSQVNSGSEQAGVAHCSGLRDDQGQSPGKAA
jgi:hypothetical protein